MKTLFSPRLLLRAFSTADAVEMFYGWTSDPEVCKFMTWYPHRSIDETKKYLEKVQEGYLKKNYYHWAICLRFTGQIVGSIDVNEFENGNPVIGYVLNRRYWNQGIMSEAFACVIDHLRDEGYKTILVTAIKENIASNRVIEKNGFTLVDSRRQLIHRKRKSFIINSYKLDL